MLDFFIPLLLGIVSFSLFIFVLPILDQRRNKKENRKKITEQSITNLILLLKDAIRSENIKNHQQLKTVLVGSDEYESIVKNSLHWRAFAMRAPLLYIQSFQFLTKSFILT